MSDFIEATCHDGKKVLMNKAWIEQVMADETESGAIIYCAFNMPNAIEQDYVRVKESYAEIKNAIALGNW